MELPWMFKSRLVSFSGLARKAGIVDLSLKLRIRRSKVSAEDAARLLPLLGMLEGDIACFKKVLQSVLYREGTMEYSAPEHTEVGDAR